MDYGFLSLIPPLLAIIFAIRTRQVYLSLLSGILLGWIILNDWNISRGFLDTLEGLVNVFSDAGNSRTIMFSALVGALILLIQRSGGVLGFIQWVSKKLKNAKNGKITVQMYAWVISVLIFVESSISVLTVGAIFRPLFDQYKIAREKLAYIIDSGSAPSCIIFPLNGWGAFIMGLLATMSVDQPFISMLGAIPFNFYALLALATVPAVIWFGWDLPAMQRAEERTQRGEVLWEGATPMISEDMLETDIADGATPKAGNMVVPILVMIAAMPVILLYTGWTDLPTDEELGSRLMIALGQGSGSKAVLISVTLAILTAMTMYKVQGIMGIRENFDWIMKGIAALVPLALLMLLAFAIGNVCKELGTGLYVSHLIGSFLTPAIIPALLFVTSAFIAFSTGTSWGTFAIMIGIAIPLIDSTGIHFSLSLAAVLGGGVFGDHCSPISDTTIIASMSSATDHVDHVRTQLPYALIVGGISTVMYLVFGFILH
ncbi:sodium:solute symporter [Membranicola marinus]|uniref:Sodium:solute symporter n=2 Tax=Membranihabitans marinus TaxID=1227546 RepID=A0A953L8L1_9BACT|nr:sodium:solute symporter [Membranihabitans marinus]